VTLFLVGRHFPASIAVSTSLLRNGDPRVFSKGWPLLFYDPRSCFPSVWQSEKTHVPIRDTLALEMLPFFFVFQRSPSRSIARGCSSHLNLFRSHQTIYLMIFELWFPTCLIKKCAFVLIKVFSAWLLSIFFLCLPFISCSPIFAVSSPPLLP